MTSLLDRHPVVSFVLLACGITWGIQIPVALLTNSVTIQFAAVVVSAFGPLLAAVILTWRGDGELRAWVRDVLSWRVPLRWYFAAFAVPFAGVAVQTVAYAAFVGSLDPALLPRRIAMWVGLFPVALLLTGGNEEFGWRGFMLPRLQRRHGALVASVVVGVVWLVWHLPSDFLMTGLGGGTTWSTGRVLLRLATIPLAVVLTWLYNSTDGSVLIAMAFHANWNTTTILVPAPLEGTGDVVATGDVGSTMTAVLVGFVTLVALAIAFRYDWESLSARDRHTG